MLLIRLKSEEGVVWLDRLGVMMGSYVLSCFSLVRSAGHNYHCKMPVLSNSRTPGTLSSLAALLFPPSTGRFGVLRVWSLPQWLAAALGKEKKNAHPLGNWQLIAINFP